MPDSEEASIPKASTCQRQGHAGARSCPKKGVEDQQKYSEHDRATMLMQLTANRAVHMNGTWCLV